MSISEFVVEPLFSIPIARTFIPNIDQNVKNYLCSLPFERVRTGCCSYSIDKKVLDDPICMTLKQQIKDKLDAYIDEIQGIDTSNFTFDIKTSWVLKIEPGDFADTHYHSKSIFSGVLYLDVSDDSSRINFHRPASHEDNMKKWFEWPIKQWNMFNCEKFFVQPENNMIVFFPSSLDHSTDENTSTIVRYCLAFDVFIKGSLDVGLPGEIHF